MKLSVVIITYNHERFIRQALESALAQRVNFEYEIVVAEDCSTDRTRDIVLEFYNCNRHRIVPLIRAKNLGGGRNVNEALESCRGEYVAFLEGDDYWTCPDKLQRQVAFLDQHPDHALCCHRLQVCDETGAGRTGLILPPRAAGSFTIEDLIAENFIGTCTVVYRRGCLEPLPSSFLDFKVCDWPRYILASRSGKIWLMDEVMAVYRMHSGGVWTSGQGIDQKYEMMRMMKALDRHMNFQYTDAIRRWRAGCYFDMAIIERLKGNRMTTLQYLAASFRNGGLSLRGRWRSLAALLAYSVFGVRRSHV